MIHVFEFQNHLCLQWAEKLFGSGKQHCSIIAQCYVSKTTNDKEWSPINCKSDDINCKSDVGKMIKLRKNGEERKEKQKEKEPSRLQLLVPL